MNKRAWRAFRHAVDREFTPEKRDEICRRYKFDWKDFAYSSKPLKREFVEFFGTGAANPTATDLQGALDQKSFYPQALEKMSPKYIHNLFEEVTDARYIGNWQDPAQVYGGAKEAHENLTHVQLNTDQQRANLFRGIDRLTSIDPNIPRLHPYYSRLEMGIVSHLETKQDCKDVDLVIPAPGTREGKVEYYKIHDIISKDGLSAVALVPLCDKSSLSPILAFRCTKQNPGQTDFIPSILNNMEKHIGKSGYRSSFEQLKALMNDDKFTMGGKVKVLAYSQGGGYAGYFLNDFWPQVDEFVGFNIVGSDARIVESLARGVNSLDSSEMPPSIFLHRNEGDWVNKSGEKHIGWGITHPNARVQVVEWSLTGVPLPTNDVWDAKQVARWLKVHGSRPMDAESEAAIKSKFDARWKYPYKLFQGSTNCSRILNTYNSDPTLEDKRRGTKILYIFFSNFYSLLDFIFRVFGIEVFRKNW
ncbi:MAG: hypothetical protein P0S96_01345 [Simkaniaceae bacterium]|nr:hypothetical protein [Candidatus Sacchlamyda saccharinae]